MFSRTTFSLALTIAVLAALVTPIEIAKAVPPNDGCCPAMQMNMDPCQRCPLHSNQTNSNSGSTCCSVQAPCFVGYSNSTDDFVAGMNSLGFTSFENDRVIARLQRPPIPPPRSALS